MDAWSLRSYRTACMCDILAFCGDLDVNFVVTVFDPNTNQIMYKVYMVQSVGLDLMALSHGLGWFMNDSMALAGLFMIRIHMVRVDSLDSDYENLLVGIYHEF
ncbi:hypothetical protein F2Q69_00060627 [Brassica cretica]|uniref:Uncharacterized protein n=1 Tax=Brassica cretica TaxID=69181 RepID=A0A8S9RPA5_BRACR|nr:hypothetical protein F2Q69_00060627 [Brassica cretica]